MDDEGFVLYDRAEGQEGKHVLDPVVERHAAVLGDDLKQQECKTDAASKRVIPCMFMCVSRVVMWPTDASRAGGAPVLVTSMGVPCRGKVRTKHK